MYMQKQTALQELLEFMDQIPARNNAIIYSKVLNLLKKEQNTLTEAFNEGKHNATFVFTTPPIKGRDYYVKNYGKLNDDI